MLTLKDNNGKPIPKDVQKRVNDFIDSLQTIKWFQPDPKLDKKAVEKQAKLTLECFGVKAGIEYRHLKAPQDWGAAWDAAWGAAWGAAWDAARGAAWDAAWGAAWDAARDAARDAAWDAAWDAARGAAWGAAWDAARGAAEILIADKIKDKYPNGAFQQLFKLWEMGLYPVGVLEETGMFVIYIPPCNLEFSNL